MNSKRAVMLLIAGIAVAVMVPDGIPVAAQNDKPQLRVAISPDIPPYVTRNATGGLEVELLRRSLDGYSLQFVQMPYKQLQSAVAENRADVSVGVRSADDGVFYSDDYLTFINVAVTKKSAKINLGSIADLKNHRVLTWQNAYLELGPQFKKLFSPQSPQRKNYQEIANQQKQVETFWAAKDDVIVIDRNIFRHFSQESGHSMSDVTLHFLFPPTTEFKVAFKSQAVRDKFNQSLQQLCRSGEYAKLLRQSQVKLPHTVCDCQEVEAAVKDFYAALNAMFTGDLEPMKKVWSHAEDVTYMSPDGKYLVGWSQVLKDWQAQAAMKLGGRVVPARIHINYGPELVVVHNIEEGENTDAEGKKVKVSIRATNVFRKEQGRWKMIGHHTDKLPFLDKQ